MEKLPEKDTGSKQTCPDCISLKKKPQSGHSKCTTHRSCTGKHQWEPEDCEICNLNRHHVSQLQKKDKNAILNAIIENLRETSTALSNDETTWEFEDSFFSFFDLNRDEELGGEQVTHNSVIEEPTITQGVNQPVVPRENSVSTNDLLLQLVGSFKELSGHIIANNTKNGAKHSRSRSRSPTPEANDGESERSDAELYRSSRKRRKTKHSKNSKKRSRKRARSPSSTSQESSDSSKSDTTTDTDQRSVSRSPSPHTSQQTKMGGEKDYFNEGSTIYFYTNNHRVVGKNKVWFNDELKDVKWHNSVNAFSLLKATSSSEAPFMSSTQAHETLVSFFKTTQDPSEKPGLDRKSYRLHFDDNSELAKALRLIQESTPEALHKLYTAHTEKYWKTFSTPTFKTPSMVNFTSGWSLTGNNYLEWAKHDELKPLPFSDSINLHYVPFIPKLYLEEEAKTRTNLVDSITGLSMLYSLAKELESNVTAHTAVEAISRHYLPQLCENSLRWTFAKTDVRKIILQGSKAPQAIKLLKSNMWEPNIFATDAVKQFMESNVLNLPSDERLQITYKTDKLYRGRPDLVDPSKLGVKDNPKKDQSFLRQNTPGQYNKATGGPSNYPQNQQYQQNRKGGGSHFQDKSRFQNKGNSWKKQKHNNANKGWNKPKQNSKGPSGFTENHKGNKKSQ